MMKNEIIPNISLIVLKTIKFANLLICVDPAPKRDNSLIDLAINFLEKKEN